METRTEYTVVTIDTLKQQALERDAARKERERQDEVERLARNERNAQMLRDMLHRTAPYSEFFDRGVVDLGGAERESHNYETQIIACFTLPGHAEIQARFVWKEKRDNTSEHWEHEGFLTNKGYEYTYWTDDPEKMWRVREWNGTKYEPETETYCAAYRTVDFKDLGDALVHAERAYRDPADIQREVDDHNHAAAERTMSGSMAAHLEIPLPEPTTAEILLDALKNYIDERIEKKKLSVEFS